MKTFFFASVLAEELREILRIGEVALLPAALPEALREKLRLLDRRRADQHRLFAAVAIVDQFEDGFVLLVRRPIDLVVLVGADHRLVGRHFDHVEAVDVHELVRLGGGGAGHAGELVVEAEIVLKSDRGERLVFRLDFGVLFRFERLVQAVGVAPSFHHAAGELVDDDHLAVLDDVVLVALEQLVGAKRVVQVMHDGDVLDVVEPVPLSMFAAASRPSTFSVPSSVKFAERTFSSSSKSSAPSCGMSLSMVM